MLKSIEATIGIDGDIHLCESIRLTHSCRAIVTIIDEPADMETSLLSQPALASDWESPEEDTAWSHLQ